MKLEIDSWIGTGIKFNKSILFSDINNNAESLKRIWTDELLIFER